MLEIELPFTNPFRHTTMLGYNPRRDPRDGRTVSHLQYRWHASLFIVESGFEPLNGCFNMWSPF